MLLHSAKESVQEFGPLKWVGGGGGWLPGEGGYGSVGLGIEYFSGRFWHNRDIAPFGAVSLAVNPSQSPPH